MSSKKKKRILAEMDSGTSHTSKMELLLKNFNRFKPLNSTTNLPSKMCDGL